MYIGKYMAVPWSVWVSFRPHEKRRDGALFFGSDRHEAVSALAE